MQKKEARYLNKGAGALHQVKKKEKRMKQENAGMLY